MSIFEDALNVLEHELETCEYYAVNIAVIRKIIEKSIEAKSNIISHLEKLDGWDADNLRLIRDINFSMPPDKKKIDDFMLLLYRTVCIESPGQSKDYINELAHLMNNNRITDEMETIFKKLDTKNVIRARSGQKVTKALRKYIDNYLSQNAITNQEWAFFCDAINEIKYERPTIISVNPIDFWLASKGTGWKSCHNIRNGEYRGGTTSYALDNSTVVMYTVSKTDNLINELRINRQLFHFGENAFLQGRLYPQDCDGEQGNTMYKEFREIMQDIYAKAYGIENQWVVTKGADATKPAHSYDGNGYDDLNYNYSGNLSLSTYKWKGDAAIPIIHVGEPAMCLGCGEPVDENSIFCDSCSIEADTVCENCGTWFNYESQDEAVSTNDEHYYCCPECAERDGYRYVYRAARRRYSNWLSEDEYGFDEYENEYFDKELKDYVVTVDGNEYMCLENALADGYVMTIDEEELVLENDAYYYEFEETELETGYYKYEHVYCIDTGNFIEQYNAFLDCYENEYYENPAQRITVINYPRSKTYSTKENAIADGCRYSRLNNRWYPKGTGFDVLGEVFDSKYEARKYGYVYDEDLGVDYFVMKG